MKEQINTIKDLLQTVRKRKEDRSTPPTIQIQKIDNPDAECSISLRIVNDLIGQNLPFSTSVDIDENNKLDLTIASAMILTGSGNSLHLKISSVGLRFKRDKIDFGVKSNNLELTITCGIRKTDDNQIMLNIYGQVSSLKLKYFPGMVENMIQEILNLVIPFPMLDVDVKQYLDINSEIANDVMPLKINKELENASLIFADGAVRVKVKYITSTKLF
ncbi:MAG: hypothetical protein HOE30_05385 [Deltaproteobacteria bacterium]|jgi:hypothetical protein|nr:hypothetical protein [Deltaproteobacteria bacterium]MBT4265734.1 hypothetical protein [Deltaproteobacteria bacterium]MBT4638059.1 hypothetical protein [Deltaproteobacteria bacterium]MBT7713937.1 hypothetical protein [Deltaproteobacteria bacterium]